MALQRVVVGLDGSAGSDEALAWATRLARETTTELILVYARTATEDHGEPARLLQAASRQLYELGIASRTIDELADPRELLPHVADQLDADLIVIGSRGQNLLLQLALGSVGEHLTHHSPRPVAIIRNDADDERAGASAQNLDGQ